ncbi:MAG TPA: DUF4097 family beta strand repeat-containing protein [Mucilaginibacter sp.]|nr:DUF4097 family beta strand repeat-containing protein [Mucilaginibacter sp.]
MKTYLLLLAIACTGCNVIAQSNQDKTPYQTRSLASDGISEVFVKTSGGSISVSGGSESPRIEVYVHGNNGQELSKEEIESRLKDDYDLNISVSNHELHATAKRKHDGVFNWRKQLSISFKIFTPRQVSSHLNTSGGSIHLDNLNGKQEFSTSGGSLHMDNLAGSIKGETSGGSIAVSNSKDMISLETSGGSIRATNCQGKIKLETSGGSLQLQDLNGNIVANTSGGSIKGSNIEGELITGTSGGSVNLSRMSCSLEASTSGGSMHVDMAKLGKYIKLDVSGGHVDLSLPEGQGMNLNLSASKIKSASLSKFSGEWEKDHVKGTLNGGGIPVSVDASDSLTLSFN